MFLERDGGRTKVPLPLRAPPAWGPLRLPLPPSTCSPCPPAFPLTCPLQRRMPPLHVSVQTASSLPITLLLLRAGADVNYRQEDLQQTALHVSCRCGNDQGTRLLLLEGADPFAADVLGRTTLHWAALGSSSDIVEKLNRQTRGSLLNAIDGCGYTPLMFAAEHGKTEVAQCLLKLGASLEVRNKFSHTALHLADWFGHKKLLDMLLEHAGMFMSATAQAQTAAMGGLGTPVTAQSASFLLQLLPSPSLASLTSAPAAPGAAGGGGAGGGGGGGTAGGGAPAAGAGGAAAGIGTAQALTASIQPGGGAAAAAGGAGAAGLTTGFGAAGPGLQAAPVAYGLQMQQTQLQQQAQRQQLPQPGARAAGSSGPGGGVGWHGSGT